MLESLSYYVLDHGEPARMCRNEPYEQAELRVSYKNYVQQKQQSGSASRTAQKPGFSTACIPDRHPMTTLPRVSTQYMQENAVDVCPRRLIKPIHSMLSTFARRRPPRSRGSTRIIQSSSAKVCGKPLDVFPRTQIPVQVHSRYVDQKERVPADGMV